MQMSKYWPQVQTDGVCNLWILQPGALSQRRGETNGFHSFCFSLNLSLSLNGFRCFYFPLHLSLSRNCLSEQVATDFGDDPAVILSFEGEQMGHSEVYW